MKGNCKHVIWEEDGHVFLSNDEDSYYVQEFKTIEEIDFFISSCSAAREQAFCCKSDGSSKTIQKRRKNEK